ESCLFARMDALPGSDVLEPLGGLAGGVLRRPVHRRVGNFVGIAGSLGLDHLFGEELGLQLTMPTVARTLAGNRSQEHPWPVSSSPKPRKLSTNRSLFSTRVSSVWLTIW